MAASSPVAVRDYSLIVRQLVGVQAFDPDIEILERGEKALSGELELAQLTAVWRSSG